MSPSSHQSAAGSDFKRLPEIANPSGVDTEVVSGTGQDQFGYLDQILERRRSRKRRNDGRVRPVAISRLQILILALLLGAARAFAIPTIYDSNLEIWLHGESELLPYGRVAHFRCPPRPAAVTSTHKTRPTIFVICGDTYRQQYPCPLKPHRFQPDRFEAPSGRAVH